MYRKFNLILALLAMAVFSQAQQASTIYSSAEPLRSIPVSTINGVYVSDTTWPRFQQRTIDPSKLTEKEISKEMNADKSAFIIIDNESRNIEVKSWDQPKVKITTKVSYEGKSDLTDQQWFERLNLSLEKNGSSVKVKTRMADGGGLGYSYVTTTNGTLFTSGQSGLTVFDANGNNIGTVAGGKRTITVYVPKDSRLEIENNYGSIILAGKIDNLDLVTKSGFVDAQSIGRLKLRSNNTKFSADDIDDAEVELNTGRFKANNITKLDIDSKYATVEINTVNNAIVRSSNDQYDIEEVNDLRGRKNYGNLRITSLKRSLDLEGSNADIKLRKIASTAESIKINNKYADLRLPVDDIKNYSVNLNGYYNTVYAPFERKFIPDSTIANVINEHNKFSGGQGSLSATSPSAGSGGTNAPAVAQNNTWYASTVNGLNTYGGVTNHEPARSTAEVGDVKGRHTVFTVVCTSCTIDFK